MAVSIDAHETWAPCTAWPFTSATSAARRSVSPATTVPTGGETATAATSWATVPGTCITVTAAVPEAEPDACRDRRRRRCTVGGDQPGGGHRRHRWVAGDPRDRPPPPSPVRSGRAPRRLNRAVSPRAESEIEPGLNSDGGGDGRWRRWRRRRPDAFIAAGQDQSGDPRDGDRRYRDALPWLSTPSVPARQAKARTPWRSIGTSLQAFSRWHLVFSSHRQRHSFQVTEPESCDDRRGAHREG